MPDHELLRPKEWCDAHPINQLVFQDPADLRRMHALAVANYAELVLDVANCQFEYHPITSVSNDPSIQRVDTDIEWIVATFYGEDERHIDAARFLADWTPVQRRKLLLFYANLTRILNLAALGEAELMLRMFRMVGVVNLVFSDCDYTADEVVALGQETKAEAVFAAIKAILNLLLRAVGPTCPGPRVGWTDRDYEEKLICCYHEILYQFAREPFGWDGILKRDVNEVVRDELVYYATTQPVIYRRVLARGGRRHRMYEKALDAGLMVMGYLAPWSDYGFWRRMMESGTYPGCACALPYPARVLGHFVAAWQYNDAAGHRFLAQEEIEPTDLLWTRIPKDAERSEHAKAILLCSVLTYFTALPRSPAGAALYCGGAQQLRDLHCQRERDLVPPPDEREPVPGPSARVRGAVTVPEMALLHAQRMMVDGLEHAAGANDALLFSDFAELARGRSKMASYLIDVAAATSRRDELLSQLEGMLVADGVPEDCKVGLEAYIKERRGEAEEVQQEDRRLWDAVARAQRYLADPEAYLAQIDAEVEAETEIPNDPAVLCDREFLKDAFEAFYCQAEPMALPEEELEALPPTEGGISPLHDVGGVLDLGDQLLELYRARGLLTEYALPEETPIPYG